MTAGQVVDILLDAVDPKLLRSLVSGSFSVKLSGVGNHWTGASCCDAILYGDGRLTLLNDNKDVVFKTKHIAVLETVPGYYGSSSLGKSFSIRLLQRLYPSLIGRIVHLYATTTDPKMKDRNHLEYTGEVQKR